MRKKRDKRSQRIKIFLIFGVIICLILVLIVSTVGRQEFNSSHKLLLELIGSAQAVVSKATTSCQVVWQDYVVLWNVHEENKKLREELRKYKAINNKYLEAVASNVRLNKLLKLKESLDQPSLTSQIVGRDPSLWFKTVIINQGSSAGVKKGMPVVTVEGVVGQIINTSPHYSKIMLAVDSNSAIDVLIQKTRVQGIIKGNGNCYQLQYILKNCNVEKGDKIVTSGLGGVFPKGLLVGTVARVVKNRRGMFQEIDIEPSVDFSQLEYLTIIMKENSLAE